MAVTDLLTPLYQKINGVVRRLLPETKAVQVKLENGTDLETKITNIDRAISQQTVSYVVPDIAGRDALPVASLHVGDQVWVIDATADATVTTGAAKYIVQAISGDPAAATFKKTGEAESLDVVVHWADVQDKPTNTVADIDYAVNATKTLGAGNHELTYDSSVSGGLMVDGVAVGGTYGAYTNLMDTDAGFDAAITALNLPNGAIVTSIKVDTPAQEPTNP